MKVACLQTNPKETIEEALQEALDWQKLIEQEGISRTKVGLFFRPGIVFGEDACGFHGRRSKRRCSREEMSLGVTRCFS